jgi:hypothetical protein
MDLASLKLQTRNKWRMHGAVEHDYINLFLTPTGTATFFSLASDVIQPL